LAGRGLDPADGGLDQFPPGLPVGRPKGWHLEPAVERRFAHTDLSGCGHVGRLAQERGDPGLLLAREPAALRRAPQGRGPARRLRKVDSGSIRWIWFRRVADLDQPGDVADQVDALAVADAQASP